MEYSDAIEGFNPLVEEFESSDLSGEEFESSLE